VSIISGKGKIHCLVETRKAQQRANHGRPMAMCPIFMSRSYAISEFPVVKVGRVFDGIHATWIDAVHMRALCFFSITLGVPPYE
jgi:hypothetical protein